MSFRCAKCGEAQIPRTRATTVVVEQYGPGVGLNEDGTGVDLGGQIKKQEKWCPTCCGYDPASREPALEGAPVNVLGMVPKYRALAS